MMTRKELGVFLGIKIQKDYVKGCWFIRGRDWSNYATIRKAAVHRTVYELYKGPLIPGREVCHTCDRKGCFCPGHLFQGTHSDNMRDALNKGRLKKPDFKWREWDANWTRIGYRSARRIKSFNSKG